MNDWIKCEDQLPEEHPTPITEALGWPGISETVLVTMVDVDVLDGKRPPYDGDRFVRSACFSDGKVTGDFIRSVVPYAWKPLPEPCP